MNCLQLLILSVSETDLPGDGLRFMVQIATSAEKKALVPEISRG